ncbi:hypothetical protein [Tautonia marina]|uniref:hypothetical protein n=1 Tax=Tautonia marina TaxID=2653855 RepID=UPI001375DCB0|nr:hypothetical protein [Tautonia marina]
MRRLLVLPFCLLMVGSASAQSFAPAQSRAAEPPPQQARVAPLGTQLGGPMELNTNLLNSGMPVPAPLGAMADAAELPGLISARVPTAGALVTVPPAAVASGVRLYTYTNPQGGLESVAYDPSTGATIVYDQTISYSLQNQRLRAGQGATPRVGSSAADGIVNNPSFSLQPGRADPQSGIPLLNQAFPSYNSRTNLGLGASPSYGTPSPFSGSPMNTLGLGSGSTPSPFAGTPMGTFGAGSGGAISSPFSGTPMGTLGGTSFGGSTGGGNSLGGGTSLGGGGALGGGTSLGGGGSLGGNP